MMSGHKTNMGRLLASRWEPPDGVRQVHPEHGAIVYLYGQCSACGYKGGEVNPAFDGHFDSPGQRDAFINAWLAGIAQKAFYQSAVSLQYTLLSNQFFSSLFRGMVFFLRDADKQTAAEFFEVTGAISQSHAIVRPVAYDRVQNDPRPKHGYAVPLHGQFIGPERVFKIDREIPVVWHRGLIVRIAWD